MARFSTQSHRIGDVKFPDYRILQRPVKVVKVKSLQGASDRPLEELGEVRILEKIPEVKGSIGGQPTAQEMREYQEKEVSDRLSSWKKQKSLPLGNPRYCAVCNAVMPPSERSNARESCSEKCRKELAKRDVKIQNTCAICDAKFVYYRKKRCCSPECEHKASQRIGQFKVNPDSVRHHDQTCQRVGCGKPFRSVKVQRYCSPKCAQLVLAPKRTTIDIEKLKELHAQGLITHHIAKALGKQHGNVSRWLTRLGLEPNKAVEPGQSEIAMDDETSPLQGGKLEHTQQNRNDPYPFGRRFPEFPGDIFYNPGGVGFVAITPFEPKYDRATDPHWDGTGDRFVDQKDGAKLCKELYPCWTCRYLDYPPRETNLVCRWAPFVS